MSDELDPLASVVGIEEQPQSFEQHHSAELAKLKTALEAKAAQRLEPVRARVLELKTKVAAADRARAFVQSSFWAEDLLPFMQAQSDRAMKPWRPGEPTDQASVEAKYFFSSGMAVSTENVLSKLRQWMDDGDAARRELAHIEQTRGEK